MSKKSGHYTVFEEVLNASTHGVGIVFGIVALVLMVVFAAFKGDPWLIVAVSIFGASMILLYLASTLYHAFPWPAIKERMRVMDHCAIYVLIAGTYTPFLLTSLRGPWGWSLLGVVWGAAVVGCVFKIFFISRWQLVATLMYLVMGWIIVVALKPAIAAVPPGAIWLMLAGGLAYSAGVIFYLCERIPYNHAIWHVFVLGGTVTHFLAIFFFLILGTAPEQGAPVLT